jgi:hypothetical protein
VTFAGRRDRRHAFVVTNAALGSVVIVVGPAGAPT